MTPPSQEGKSWEPGDGGASDRSLCVDDFLLQSSSTNHVDMAATPPSSPKPSSNSFTSKGPDGARPKGPKKGTTQPSQSLSPAPSIRRVLSINRTPIQTPAVRLPSKGDRRGKMRMAMGFRSERALRGDELQEAFKNLLDESLPDEPTNQTSPAAASTEDDNKSPGRPGRGGGRSKMGLRRSISSSKLSIAVELDSSNHGTAVTPAPCAVSPVRTDNNNNNNNNAMNMKNAFVIPSRRKKATIIRSSSFSSRSLAERRNATSEQDNNNNNNNNKQSTTASRASKIQKAAARSLSPTMARFSRKAPPVSGAASPRKRDPASGVYKNLGSKLTETFHTSISGLSNGVAGRSVGDDAAISEPDPSTSPRKKIVPTQKQKPVKVEGHARTVSPNTFRRLSSSFSNFEEMKRRFPGGDKHAETLKERKAAKKKARRSRTVIEMEKEKKLASRSSRSKSPSTREKVTRRRIPIPSLPSEGSKQLPPRCESWDENKVPKASQKSKTRASDPTLLRRATSDVAKYFRTSASSLRDSSRDFFAKDKRRKSKKKKTPKKSKDGKLVETWSRNPRSTTKQHLPGEIPPRKVAETSDRRRSSSPMDQLDFDEIKAATAAATTTTTTTTTLPNYGHEREAVLDGCATPTNVLANIGIEEAAGDVLGERASVDQSDTSRVKEAQNETSDLASAASPDSKVPGSGLTFFSASRPVPSSLLESLDVHAKKKSWDLMKALLDSKEKHDIGRILPVSKGGTRDGTDKQAQGNDPYQMDEQIAMVEPSQSDPTAESPPTVHAESGRPEVGPLIIAEQTTPASLEGDAKVEGVSVKSMEATGMTQPGSQASAYLWDRLKAAQAERTALMAAMDESTAEVDEAGIEEVPIIEWPPSLATMTVYSETVAVKPRKSEEPDFNWTRNRKRPQSDSSKKPETAKRKGGSAKPNSGKEGKPLFDWSGLISASSKSEATTKDGDGPSESASLASDVNVEESVQQTELMVLIKLSEGTTGARKEKSTVEPPFDWTKKATNPNEASEIQTQTELMALIKDSDGCTEKIKEGNADYKSGKKPLSLADSQAGLMALIVGSMSDESDSDSASDSDSEASEERRLGGSVPNNLLIARTEPTGPAAPPKKKSFFDSDTDDSVSEDTSDDDDSTDDDKKQKGSSISHITLLKDESKGVATEAEDSENHFLTESGRASRRNMGSESSFAIEDLNGSEFSVSSSTIEGTHNSMPQLPIRGDDFRKMPVFPKKAPRMFIAPRALSESFSALDNVQFKPRNFVQQRDDRFDDHYELGQLLGEGEFGEVFVGYQKQGSGHGEERAIKIIDKDRMCKGDYEQVINEFNLLKGLTHPNLLTLYGFYEDEGNCYIVTDICKGGELWDELYTRGKFDEADTAYFMTILLSAVKFLQSHNIVHRDINLENILLEENKQLDQMKIIDFGLATKYEDGVKLSDLVGKVHYVAPDVLHQSYEGSKYDPWSCGVVCYILLSGYSPFEGATDGLVMEQILLGKVDFNDPAWDGISEEAKDFVQHLLTYEEDSRPTAEQAMKHAWIQNSIKSNTATFMQDYGESSVTCFENIFDFASNASLKLKEVVYTYIASQLLRKEEREEIDRVFRGMDNDCDGKLSKADVRKGYKLFFDKELSGNETDKLFERINTSETGYIDYTEFIIAAMQKSKILNADKLIAAFSKFDRGDKGYISEDDLKVTLSGVVALPTNDANGMSADQIIEEMMKEVDVEGDGKISYQNFADMMLQSGGSGASYGGGVYMDLDEDKGADSKQETSSNPWLGGQDLNTKDPVRASTLAMDWSTAIVIGHDSDDWAHQNKEGGNLLQPHVVESILEE